MNKEKEEELFIPKTKYKGLKICLALLLIIGLAAGCYFLYQYKFNNPKTIVNNAIKEAKQDIQEILKEDTSKNNDKYKIDGHLKFDTNIDDETLQILKNIEMQFNGELDQILSIGNFGINAKYKNDKLIDIKAFYEKNIIYLLLDGVYDKYIKFDTKEEKIKLPTDNIPKVNVNPQDVQTIINSMIDSFEVEINKLEIKKTDATITIDNKDVNVINNYIELKDKEVNNVAKGIIANLKKDQKFLEAVKKVIGEDIKESLEISEKSIDEEEYKGIYKISFYTDKGLFNKKIVSVRQTFVQDGTTVSLNVDKVSDDEIIVSITTTGITYLINIKKNNSVVNMLFDVNVLGQYVKIELNMNYEKIKNITKPDISNNIDANSLTEADQQKIEEKLRDNKALLKLVEEINKVGKKEA